MKRTWSHLIIIGTVEASGLIAMIAETDMKDREKVKHVHNTRQQICP